VIRFENVGKTYENGAVVLKDVNLEVRSGELMVLIGPSGCGKTTTMRMINRLIDPTSGRILINGEDIRNKDPVLLRRDIGYVIQQIGLFPHMTIEENIALVPKLKKWDKSRYLKRVDELLDLVGLDPSEFKKRYPAQLSGGQQQRVGVIRALAADPSIVLMDEPFSALDPISREQLQDELIKLRKEINKTIVFVTHDMDEALKIAQRIAIMRNGEIIQVDTPENILRFPKDDFVREFIGNERLNRFATRLTARQVMANESMVLGPQHSIMDALELMKKHGTDHIFLVDHDQTLLGKVSMEDIGKLETYDNFELRKLAKEAVHVAPEASIGEIARTLKANKMKSLPVVADNKLCGIITPFSLIHGLAGEPGSEPA